MVGSTQWGTRHFAAAEKNAVFGDRRFAGAGAYSPFQPIAVIAVLENQVARLTDYASHC